MRLFIVIISVILIPSWLSLTSFGNVCSKQVDSNEVPDDISAYYGFEQIEIIKLDWGIKDLRIADVTDDDKDDLVTIIHDRIIIYPQD